MNWVGWGGGEYFKKSGEKDNKSSGNSIDRENVATVVSI